MLMFLRNWITSVPRKMSLTWLCAIPSLKWLWQRPLPKCSLTIFARLEILVLVGRIFRLHFLDTVSPSSLLVNSRPSFVPQDKGKIQEQQLPDLSCTSQKDFQADELSQCGWLHRPELMSLLSRQLFTSANPTYPAEPILFPPMLLPYCRRILLQ